MRKACKKAFARFARSKNSKNINSKSQRILKIMEQISLFQFTKTYSDLLVEIRESKDWTQQQLANFLGVRQNQISQWEGGACPNVKFRARIRQAYAQICGQKSA